MSTTNPVSTLSPDNITFPGIPPFPKDVPIAPLLRIELRKLLEGDKEEEERCWRACCELGFFYVDLRAENNTQNMEKKANGREHGNGNGNGNIDQKSGKSEDDGSANKGEEAEDVTVDGEALLADAEKLFHVQEEFFQLPVEEKVKYDFMEQGSYFGYKGYGAGIVDKEGNKDRNEFYNISKDDILHLTPPLPAPSLLTPHRPLFASYIAHSHALCTLLLRLLSARLGLPPLTLHNLHRLDAISGDQIRFVRAPPQPPNDRKTALGEHTDFGSVTVLFNRLGGLQVRLPEGMKAVGAERASGVAAEGASGKQDGKRDGDGNGGGGVDLTGDGWAYVLPLPGHAIVNLGDALVKFSAGVLRSNIHRVVPPPGLQGRETRYSLVYFSRPEDEVVLRALRGGKVVEEALREKGELVDEGEGVSSKEWILRRALGRRREGGWEGAGGTEEVSLRRGANGIKV